MRENLGFETRESIHFPAFSAKPGNLKPQSHGVFFGFRDLQKGRKSKPEPVSAAGRPCEGQRDLDPLKAAGFRVYGLGSGLSITRLKVEFMVRVPVELSVSYRIRACDLHLELCRPLPWGSLIKFCCYSISQTLFEVLSPQHQTMRLIGPRKS